MTWLHTSIFLRPAHNLFLGVLIQALKRFLMILPHKLFSDIHITKTTTIKANLYLVFIVNHIKITICWLRNTQVVFIEHRLIIFYWKKRRNSIRRCRTYFNVNVDSDHRTVTANLKISLCVTGVVPKIFKKDIQALNGSTDIQELYQIKVSTRFAALSNMLCDKTPQDKNDEVAKILEQVNNTVLHKSVT